MTAGKKRILVVDDSEEVREANSLILEEGGYTVDTAENGKTGFAKVQRDRPDLVIADIVMPNLDGFGLLLKLRSDLAPPIPPVILCSGFDLTEEQALRRGAARFLRKPVDPDDLLAAVADVLAGRPADAKSVARERAHVSAARRRANGNARELLRQIDAHQSPTAPPHEQVAFDSASALARYFGVDAVALSLLRDDRLLVAAASEGSALPPVLCAIDSESVEFESEDLSLMRLFSEASSAVMSAWAHGRPEHELPTRFGPGIVPRFLFEKMLAEELRLLDRKGGSMELAVVKLTDLGTLRSALASSASPKRMLASVLTDGCVALYKRSPDGEAGRQLAGPLETIRASAEGHAAGVIDLAVAGLSPLSAPDLIRLAELALDKTLDAEVPGLHRLVVEERPVLQ
jgi:CheY-like chemotaxis protein